MKIKSLLIFVFTLMSLTAFAQSGGIKGKVVSREGRVAVDGVKVSVTPGEMTATTDGRGGFVIENVEPGEYTLQFEAPEFEPLTLVVRVDKMVRDINTVILVPEVLSTVMDDSIFAEFDTESGNDAQSLPSSLSASKDVFNNIASYRFSEMRFNVRGYDSQYSDVYLNGIRFNDAMTGYTPWSLWSGLNDATRNQEITNGSIMSDYGVGSIGGTTNINARASQVRQGLRVSLVNANSMYRFRAMVTYGSGLLDNGWSYALSVSTRQGGNSYVDGVYYNSYGYFASAEKIFNSRHRLGFTIMGAPTERGAQQASTQEAYDLVGNNYYNPNWGYQDGKMRNARVRNSHEPIAMINYTFDPNEHTQFNLATSFRFGKNGYSALTWYDGADPRPDYYRYMPSYKLLNATDLEAASMAAASLADQWMRNVGNIRHFDWDEMYQTNMNFRNAEDEAIYGPGARSNYIIEERHTDQLDWNLAAQISRIYKDNSRLTAGANVRINRTWYYDEVKDLLGGDYYVDVDKFAQRDFGDPIMAQNDMDYYNQYGHARAVREGDKFSYNYKAHLRSGGVWATYATRFGGFGMKLGAELGGLSMWREGLWRKGLFLDNSKGKSEKLEYFVYKAKGNFDYVINANHTFELNAVAMQNAPAFQSAFVSPRTRNSVTPGLTTEKVYGIDASYNLRYGDYKLRVSGYYTKVNDRSKVISFYDDVLKTYTNFALSGIDEQYFGLEVAASIPIYNGLSLNGAISWGQYTYTSNPNYVQIADNSAEPLSSGTVYWKDMRVESTPQTAMNIGLSYRGPHNIYASIDLNYYNNMYLSMNLLYRTDEVLLPTMTDEQIRELRSQEKFDSAYTLSASIGKNFYIQRRYTLGFSLQVNNILNNQNIKTGGYEQMRVQGIKTGKEITSYQKFAPKYFYLFGTTYYLNVYFRF